MINSRRLIKYTARKLRQAQTTAEEILWRALRNRQLAGSKFLRQHPIKFKWNGKDRFIVADFYCHESRLIIELDGPVHERLKEYDSYRDYLMKSLGMRILRAGNDRIISDLNGVLNSIKSAIVIP
jgi:very-short-patch-repair endonuclease